MTKTKSEKLLKEPATQILEFEKNLNKRLDWTTFEILLLKKIESQKN